MRLGARKIIFIKNKQKKCVQIILLVAAFFVLSACAALYTVNVLRPLFFDMARAKANEIGIMTINRVVSEKLKNDGITFSDLVSVTYGDDGKITSCQSSTYLASVLKSDLAKDVTKELSKIQKSEVGITLGSLSGIDILYGTGPIIPIEIRPYGYAKTDLKTKFHEEGINQTAFEIVAEVSCDVSILMPLAQKSEKITTTVPLASAIIVGDVPESYTNVDRDGSEYEDDVLQLAE